MNNSVPKPGGAIDAVVVDSNMTASEARRCIEEIKGHLSSVRKLLLDLDERRGWEALGYESMRQCMVAEFGRSQSQLYRELKAGLIEREISPMGEIGLIPERQLREIGKLPQQQWSSAWDEAVKTAPPKGVTTSHVGKTVASIKNSSAASGDQDFVLGEWVEVRTRHGNPNWDGLRGSVTRVEKYEITVQLDDDRWKNLRFYRDELIKVPAQSEQLNQIIESAYQCGDLVMIDCPRVADRSQRLHNGCWGTVVDLGRCSVEVVVRGQRVRFMNSDVKNVDNPTPILRDIASRLNQLFNRDDLDELDRQILEFYVRRLNFTDKQLERLAHVWDVYTKSE